MDDLVQWLTQVWDEEEAAAKACAEVYPSPWDVYDRGWMAKVQADEPNFRHVTELEQHGSIEGWLGARLEHIARHDPASVLARIAADRKILADYQHAASLLPQLRSVDERKAWHAAGEERALLKALHRLAERHADRPGLPGELGSAVTGRSRSTLETS